MCSCPSSRSRRPSWGSRPATETGGSRQTCCYRARRQQSHTGRCGAGAHNKRKSETGQAVPATAERAFELSKLPTATHKKWQMLRLSEPPHAARRTPHAARPPVAVAPTWSTGNTCRERREGKKKRIFVPFSRFFPPSFCAGDERP